MNQPARNLECGPDHQDAGFSYEEDHQAHLRAEIHACYSCTFGLNRDEFRHLLAPAKLTGSDYSAESFRVPNSNEICKRGEYCTDTCVLTVWHCFDADVAFTGLRL